VKVKEREINEKDQPAGPNKKRSRLKSWETEDKKNPRAGWSEKTS